MVGPDLDRLAQLKKDGVMTVQLTYNNRNLSGDGALEPANAGLSKLGRATIERIEAEKLLLDLSHGGARTMAEAAAHAKRPLVISHTAARALNDHPRNTADDTMRAVADKGGVSASTACRSCARQPAEGRGPDSPHRACREDRGRGPCRHRHRQWRAAARDHRGDQEQPRKWACSGSRRASRLPARRSDVFPIVADYNSVDRYRRFAGELAKRGWSQSRLEKLFGANFLRVYREAWGG